MGTFFREACKWRGGRIATEKAVCVLIQVVRQTYVIFWFKYWINRMVAV